MTREYLASVASVDRNVGRLLQELKRQNLQQNTVIIFSSDHGYNMGHNGIWHKGNGHWVLNKIPGIKTFPPVSEPNMYDNSLRIPTAVLWPASRSLIRNQTDGFQSGLVSDAAGNGKCAFTRKLTIRGTSIVPLLKIKS